MQDEQIQTLKAALEAELASVEHQLGDLSDDVGEGLDVESDEGFADSAASTAERSSMLGLQEQLQASRKEITDALARIESGTYGRCERCDKEIPFERLEALPSTHLCVDCKQALSA